MMTTKLITEYYKTTKNRDIRQDLIYAIEQVEQPKVAIDCGCGAGADIEYLLSKDFLVYGFDSEDMSIAQCKDRFKDKVNAYLSKDTFRTFKYPKSSLVVADASLFFCPKKDFDYVWRKIHQCLSPKGIFCGSFLGPEDTMASPDYNKDDYWSDILVLEKERILALFDDCYEILRFNEHKSSGEDQNGKPHNWHIFAVVAKKIR